MKLARFVSLFVAFTAAAFASVDITLPSGQVNVAYTPYTVTTNPPAGAGTIYGATGLPSGMSINTSSGTISGTPLEAGDFTGTLSINDNGATNNFTYALTIAPALGAPEITNALTALGAVGDPFTFALTASNSPTSYNVGTLPAGLSYDSANAQITGTPTTAGTYNVSLSANNATGAGGAVTLVVTIAPSGPVPTIDSAASVTANLNQSLSYQITASNTPTSFTASNLPVGLTLNTSTGEISGTPTVAGVSTATLTASNGNGASANFSLTFILGPVAIVNSATTVTGYAGAAIGTYQLTATNSPTSFTVGTLPSGLSYSTQTQQITGTPSAVGNSTVSITANNAVGTGPAFTLSIQIAAPTAPSISAQPASQTKNVGESVTFTVTASGTPSPTYQWKKGSSDIDGATSSSYTINPLTLGDAADYTVVVTNAGGSVTSDVATLTVNQVGFAAWQATNFTSGELSDANVSGPAADPDHDGVANLTEYALGTDPKAASTSGLPAITVSNGEWVFTYTRPADRSDLTYTVETSTNLSTWTTTGITHERVSTGATETWRGRLTITAGQNAFFRLKVDRP
ncbi:MAG: putative Ig domain-containing protein [Opitutae bacterium]|nr:putative Ig domain-containing protein [Opitutae bacterium]